MTILLRFTDPSVTAVAIHNKDNHQALCSLTSLFSQKFMFITLSIIGVLLVVCIALLLILCTLIFFYKRALVRLSVSRAKHLILVNRHSCPAAVHDASVLPHFDHVVNSRDVYGTTMSLNQSAHEAEQSRYLHLTFCDDDLSDDDQLENVVTCLTFPVMMKESGHNIQNRAQCCEIVSGDSDLGYCPRISGPLN